MVKLLTKSDSDLKGLLPDILQNYDYYCGNVLVDYPNITFSLECAAPHGFDDKAKFKLYIMQT